MALRTAIERLFNTPVTITKVIRTDLGGGRWSEDPTVIGTEICCRISALSSREIEIALRRYGEVTHAGAFKHGQELAPGYLVSDDRGRDFTVTEIIEPSIPEIYQKAIMFQRLPNP